LTEGSKSVRVEVKDSKNKTFAKAITVTVTAAENIPPAKPTVTLVRDNGKFTVSWTAVESASGYQVVWARSTTVPESLNAANSADISSPNTRTYTVENAVNGDEYSVWVRAKKADNTYTDYSERKTVTPQNLADEKPGKPAVTVTSTDNGQLKIEWTTAQWADNYKVLISERNSLTSAAANVVTPDNFTGLTITTGSANARITLPLQGVTNLQYYVWVIALNGNLETESDQATGTIIGAPAEKADFAGTTWKSDGGATYTFTAASVVYKNMAGTPEGEGTYDYVKPDLTLTIAAAGTAQHPEWTPAPQITVEGKTFTINNVTFTKQ
jgi:hypothetical protein